MAMQAQKKKRTKGGRYSTEITKEEIEQYYHLPCEEASRHLGIGLTILKRICRRLGIEKWPYRALKRAAKLGEAGGTAAAATSAPSGGSKRSGTSASPASSSPIDGAAVLNGRQLSPGRAAQPGYQWDGPEVPKAASNGDTGDSWQGRRGAPDAPPQLSAAQRLAGRGGSGGNAASPLARQGSAPTPAGKKASPPLPRRQAGESRRRGSLDRPQDGERGRSGTAGTPAGASRRSLDLGVLARGAGRTLSPSPESSSGGGGGSGGTPGLQRAPSGGLKRIREDDVLLAALNSSAQAVDTPPNPFALASAGVEDDWQPAGIAGGVEDAATDQLAAGLSRLEMRTLSLKRQCSRDDTALDALDQALLMERLAAQDPSRPPLVPGLARALSMPTAAAQRRSPPIPQFVTKHAAPHAAPQGGWLAQEQLRLLPRAAAAHGPLPQARPQARADPSPFAASQQLDVLAGPFDSEPPLLSDPSLAAMLFGMPLPSPKALLPVDIATESCLLPDLSPPADPLRRASSSGLLLECGEQGTSLQHASSSGSARMIRGASSVDVPEQAAAGALRAQQHPAGGPPAQGDPPVTAVGPAGAAGSGAEAGLPARPLGSSVDLLSPFGDVNDHEVEDLLADFLSPSHTGPAAEQLLGELLLPLSPTGARTGSADDALAGLGPPQLSAGPGATEQLPGSAGGAAAAAATAAQPTAFAGAAVPYVDAQPLGDLQCSGGSPLSAGAMGSGSIQSFDTPTSTGAMALPAATDLPLSDSTGTLQLAAKLLADPDPVKHALAAELLQRAQAKQAAQQAQAAQLPRATPQPQQQQQQPQPPLTVDWAQLEQQLAAQLAPAAQQLPLEGAPAPTSQAKPSLAALAQELQQAVQVHREAQQQYLMHREQVRSMLLQRQLGPSGSVERAAQLARLKSLKLQLATAQQRQNELRVAYEAQLQQLLLQQQQQQQLHQVPLAAQDRQPPMHGTAVQQGLGGGGPGGLMAFDALTGRLGPPPPLPSSAGLTGFGAAGGMPGMGQLGASQPAGGLSAAPVLPAQPLQAAYGNQPLLQELLAQPELAPNSSVTALLHEWTAKPGATAVPSAQPELQLPGAWPVPAAAAGWGALPPQQLQPRLAVQQMQPGRLSMAQRASSAPAPLPFDFDWATMLP